MSDSSQISSLARSPGSFDLGGFVLELELWGQRLNKQRGSEVGEVLANANAKAGDGEDVKVGKES